jgi:hypothetical protein
MDYGLKTRVVNLLLAKINAAKIRPKVEFLNKNQLLHRFCAVLHQQTNKGGY